MKTCHRDFFKQHGLKNTPSRDRVFHLLEKEVLTAEQIFHTMQQHDQTVSFSTVYRILEKFVAKGIIEPLKLNNENSVYYQLITDHHHHQLVCTACHHIQTIEECPLDDFEQKLAKDHQFLVHHHQMTLYGLCQDCQQNKN
jgi:Fe2+ or Zn2+ uptake regulation protein